MVNPFTTSSQEKSTLQEVGASLSKSAIRRRLHVSKYRRFTTRCKQGQIRLCQKKPSKKKPDNFWKSMKHTGKATQEILRVKNVNYSARAKSISRSQPDWACISLAEDKTKDRKPYKHNNWSQLQQRPGKASQKRKASLWWCPWDPDLRQSLPVNDSKPISKLNIYLWLYLFVQLHLSPWKWGTVYKNGCNSFLSILLYFCSTPWIKD